MRLEEIAEESERNSIVLCLQRDSGKKKNGPA